MAGEGGCAPYAAIGLLEFDSGSTVRGSLTESRPGPSFGERTISEQRYSGRYSVNANGLGALYAEGAEDIDGYLALREITVQQDGPRAQEIALIFRAVDPASGSLRTGVGWRRPDSVVLSNSCLQGRYTGFAIGRGGQVPMAGFGVLRYDGNGGFTEENLANVQGETIRTRQFVQGADQGNYRVKPDGTGTLAGGGVLFVITRVSMADGEARAEAYSLLVREPVPTNGAFFTGTVRRISD